MGTTKATALTSQVSMHINKDQTLPSFHHLLQKPTVQGGACKSYRTKFFCMERKRDRDGDEANCRIMLSQVTETKTREFREKVFECKTCNRTFPSFQALDCHRASHNRLKMAGVDGKDESDTGGFQKEPKMHGCSICGKEFKVGQALGGHMRRHRGKMNKRLPPIPTIEKWRPVLKRSSSIRLMFLDLNLTPLENDLKVLFGKKAPKVDLSIV